MRGWDRLLRSLVEFKNSVSDVGAFWCDPEYSSFVPLNSKSLQANINSLRVTGCLESSGVGIAISNAEITGLTRILVHQAAYRKGIEPVVGSYDDWMDVAAGLAEPYGVARGEVSPLKSIQARVVPGVGIASIRSTPLFFLDQTSFPQKYHKSLMKPFYGAGPDLSTINGLASWTAKTSYNLGLAGVMNEGIRAASVGVDGIADRIVEAALSGATAKLSLGHVSNGERVMAKQFLIAHLAPGVSHFPGHGIDERFHGALNEAVSTGGIDQLLIAASIAERGYDLISGREVNKEMSPVEMVERARRINVECELEAAGIDQAAVKSPRDVLANIGL